MREIVERLTENRQLEKAKSILESNGYTVSKKSKGKRLRENESPITTLPYDEILTYDEMTVDTDSWKYDMEEEEKEGKEEIWSSSAKLLNSEVDNLVAIVNGGGNFVDVFGLDKLNMTMSNSADKKIASISTFLHKATVGGVPCVYVREPYGWNYIIIDKKYTAGAPDHTDYSDWGYL